MSETLPSDWPEQYSRMGTDPSCNHFMHWDSEDEVYRCINNCGYTEETPPDSKTA